MTISKTSGCLVGKTLSNLNQCPQVQKTYGRIKVSTFVYSLDTILSYDPWSASYPVPLESRELILSQQDTACKKHLYLSKLRWCHDTLHWAAAEMEKYKNVYFFLASLQRCSSLTSPLDFCIQGYFEHCRHISLWLSGCLLCCESLGKRFGPDVSFGVYCCLGWSVVPAAIHQCRPLCCFSCCFWYVCEKASSTAKSAELQVRDCKSRFLLRNNRRLSTD